ncbi:MSCRAMM family protein [Amedibacillus sp. YH-ame6]
MSKHLKEVFASRFQMHLLETIQPEPCNVKGTMDIIVEEVNDDGSPWKNQAKHFVKICHSQNECTHAEINIDEQSGIGKMTLNNMGAMQYRISQVDECGTQMINGDMYEVTYRVDDEEMESDYATVMFDEQHSHRTLHIINRRLSKAYLQISKSLRDRRGNPKKPCEDMEFLIRITRSDCYEKFVKLNVHNGFCASVEDLCAGVYHIEEFEYCDYRAFYRLNEQEETTSTLFELMPGTNILHICNEERMDTQLTIEKYVRNNCGELNKPSCFEEFQVSIISDEHDECITLCEENDFCATLYGLTPGFYDIQEVNCDGSLYETSYIVGGCDESEGAQLQLCEGNYEEVWIINSNIERNTCCDMQPSALRICKFIRGCDGRVCRPQEDAQFKVMVRGCGMNEAFYLNANNNFCIDLASLCVGEYEVCEISCGEYNTSYSINGGREKTSACLRYDGSENFCVSIINEERNRGSICVSKYIRNEYGDMMKPEKGQCFQVSLSSYFCKRCFELNEDNDFSMCFHDLRFGSYEIREEETCEYETSYQVDCERERRHARVMVDDCCDHEVKIINSITRNNSGILKISKFIETASKELVKPARDEEFEVEVEGPCFSQCYVLRASNNWCIQLEGLQEGEYQISECGSACYETTYLVNREICKEAFVYMGDCNQDVCIINRAMHSGSLTLSACVRRCDGCMEKPSNGAFFEILVEGSDDCFKVCLDASNQWCAVLDELCEGKYRIIQKDNMGYKVSYIVHGREESFGKIKLGSQDEEVMIINEETACMGSVIVTKYIMDEHGDLCTPCPQDEFHFELSGRCFCRTYTLRNRNDFCIYFDDLDEGEYEIRELDEGYDVQYRINNSCVEHACFVLGRDDLHVDIINSISREGMVHIEKRIRKGSALVKPSPEDCFQILLKGKNIHEVYELNCDNDFRITLCDLCKQHYEIKELNSACKTCYNVDGNLQSDGYFLFDGEPIDVTIINEEMLFGCIELNKVIASEDGRLIKPNRYECFEVLVESDCFKQKVVLSKDNDFCAKLYDLPQGHYEVKELNNDGYVSYLINDLPYESACVDVCEDDVCITIINHPCALGSLHFQGMVEEQGCLKEPRCEDEFVIQVSGKKCCEELIFNNKNEFQQELCNLIPDSYMLKAIGNENVRFEMEGQCFDDEVCIDLRGEDVCVNVIVQKNYGVDITIHKCMMDCHGNLLAPEHDACFEVQLIHAESVKNYTLNSYNNFTQIVENCFPGKYEIKECGCDTITLVVNDQCAQNHGSFEVGTHDVQVTLINTMKSSAYLHIETRIQDGHGRLIKPHQDMCFEMEVKGEHFHEKFMMSCQNSWHEKVWLEEGMYEVTQKADCEFDDVYYLVNDQKMREATLTICDEDQYVTAINEECSARGSIEICKLIRDEEGCYCYPAQDESYWITIQGACDTTRILLNADNHFYASIRSLKDGYYEVMEEQGSDQVEYIVNNATPSSSGRVHVAGNANTINIINPMNPMPKNGSIDLIKYMETSDGIFVKPQSGMYRIHVSKPGYNEMFYLSKENSYRMRIDGLEDGLYVVNEVDVEGVTYIVNGGSQVDRASVQVRNNANKVEVINPETVSKTGSITLAKYIRENNQLRRPTGTASYVFLVSRPGFNQLYTLDASNQWMQTIEDLEDGDYVINETTNEDKVTYIVNGGSEVDRAVVSVSGNSNTLQIINTQKPSGKGSIHIEKYVRVGMKLRRPTGDYEAEIFISKPGYNENFLLNESNGWMVDVKDLESGLYVIDEVGNNDVVTYIINGGSEVSNGVVSVDNDENMVMMINTMNEESSSIKLNKYVRDGSGVLHSPSANEQFQVEVSGPDGYRSVVVLNASNGWSSTLKNLSNGYYTVKEMSNLGYSVSYIVDNGLETNNASIYLQDNAHTVNIINSSGEMMGRLEITKLIKNADGTLIMPADGDIYFVEVSNESTIRKIQLDSGNMFTSVLQDLPEGQYRVLEIANLEYLTTYRVNGGPEATSATVMMASGINNQVEVINELRGNRNTIEVFKYMLDNDGNYLPPVAPDTYQFSITGINNEVNETYDLNVDNSWHQSLRTLPSGTYQVKELGTSPFPVKYLINSADLKEEAIFNAAPGSTTVIGIINLTSDNTGQGTMVITKRIRDINGALNVPMDGEIFTVTVNGQNTTQIVTLEPENNYTFTLSDIAFGVYTVEEVGADYNVTYRVNEGQVTSTGVVNVDSSAMNVVLVINSRLDDVSVTSNVMKRQDSVVRVVIE